MPKWFKLLLGMRTITSKRVVYFTSARILKKNLNTIDHVIFDLCNVHTISWQVGNHEAIFLSSTILFFLIQAMFIHWITGLPVIFIIMATFEETGLYFIAHVGRHVASVDKMVSDHQIENDLAPNVK